MEIAFHYADVETDKSENIFIVPAGVTGGKERTVHLKNKIEEILSVFYFHKNFISIAPSDSIKSLIRGILVYIKPESIYIGQLWLQKEIGFDGFCLYTDGVQAVFSHENSIHRIDLGSKDHKKQMKQIFDPPEDVSEDQYGKYVNSIVVGNSKVFADKKVMLQQTKNEVNRYKLEIKKRAPQYFVAKKSLEKIRVAYKTMEPEIKELVEIGSKEKFAIVKETAKMIDSYSSYKNVESEMSKNLQWLEKSTRSTGLDFGAIKKMLSKGFIEKFGYNKKLGLFWVYPPTDYQYYTDRNRKSETECRIFLGKVRVCVPAGGKLIFSFLSYPKDSECSNYHIKNRAPELQDYCLGSFEDTIKSLTASGQIAQLITVAWNYILSSNPDSRATDPNYDKQKIENPQVIDDSFEVWKKKSKKSLKKEAKDAVVEVAL